MSQPQALIVYGDGVQALYYEEKNMTVDRKGVKVIPMLVAPSIELRIRYGIKDDDLNIVTDDGKKAMWVEYPTKHIKWLNRSKTGAVILVFCGYDGSRTELMDLYQDMFDWDLQRDKNESRLRGLVSKLHKDLEDALIIQAELFRKLNESAMILTHTEEHAEEGEENV